MEEVEKKTRQIIIDLYKEGITRPSRIKCAASLSLDQEEIYAILLEYKATEFQKQTVKDVSYKEILRKYQIEKKDVLDILSEYEDLTFKDVKEVIEGYYKMLSIKKPRKIKFPRKLIKEYLETHNIEDACVLYGYDKETIERKIQETKDLDEMTKEELFAFKMKILERDVNRLENKEISWGSFQKDYPTLTPSNAKVLIQQYKKSKTNEQ